MQALILAAGMGKRLKDLTREGTKCMVKVGGCSLIARLLPQLAATGIKKVVMVVGYKAAELKAHIAELEPRLPIEFVLNPIYDQTNNIYSLYLAREHLLKDDTVILESDLVFEDAVLTKLLDYPYPNLALVAKYESWMDGTVVTLDQDCNIKSFLTKKDFQFSRILNYYKTVNIYKFSRDFSRTHYLPFLEAYCRALGHNEYYEQVLKVIALLDKPEIKALPLEGEKWYEIDDAQDLDIADSIFTEGEQTAKISGRYGGYWRYPDLLDFCYLVNPYYPPPKLLDEIRANFDRLITAYPSSQRTNSLLAANYFSLMEPEIVVGNGAAELIKAVTENFPGRIGTVVPSFEEYLNRRPDSKVFKPDNPNFSYSAGDLKKSLSDCQALLLVNPDNPSGNYIPQDEMLDLAGWAEEKNKTLIVDESFIDFIDNPEPETLLNREILHRFPHLVVIKSLSKSFGVAGLRLGVAASADLNLMTAMKKELPIWNINSLAEFFLQIFYKYQDDYWDAQNRFKETRKEFLGRLSRIKNLRVIPSQANYVTCELLKGFSAAELTDKLLLDHQILIKNLSGKRGITGQYIRVAIKTNEENIRLATSLSEILAPTI